MKNIICKVSLVVASLLFFATIGCNSAEISDFENINVSAEEGNEEEDNNRFKEEELINGQQLVLKNASEWGPEHGKMINLPNLEECGTKDSLNQTNFAELLYLNMFPPCELTSKTGYCGIRRHQNITLIAKFATKIHNQQLRVRAHLVDKLFGFETAIWPEFGACQPFFNITCPQEPDLVHSFVLSDIPKEIPALSTIVRVRLISVNQDNEKNVAICRQIKLHVI